MLPFLHLFRFPLSPSNGFSQYLLYPVTFSWWQLMSPLFMSFYHSNLKGLAVYLQSSRLILEIWSLRSFRGRKLWGLMEKFLFLPPPSQSGISLSFILFSSLSWPFSQSFFLFLSGWLSRNDRSFLNFKICIILLHRTIIHFWEIINLSLWNRM